MRKQLAICITAICWYGIVLTLLRPVSFPELGITLTLVVLQALTVFKGSTGAVIATLTIGILFDVSGYLVFGVQSMALILTCLVLPEALSTLVRNPYARFIALAASGFGIYAASIWLLNSLVRWFDATLSPPVNTFSWDGGLIASLCGCVFATLILLIGRTIGAQLRGRFYFRTARS